MQSDYFPLNSLTQLAGYWHSVVQYSFNCVTCTSCFPRVFTDLELCTSCEEAVHTVCHAQNIDQGCPKQLAAGRINRLLLWYIYIFLKTNYLFLYWHRYMKMKRISHCSLLTLKIIWLAQRYTIISSLCWVLGITCRKPQWLKAWVYTNKIEKLWLLWELTLLEICARNQAGDFKDVKISWSACPQTPLEGIAFSAR